MTTARLRAVSYTNPFLDAVHQYLWSRSKLHVVRPALCVRSLHAAHNPQSSTDTITGIRFDNLQSPTATMPGIGFESPLYVTVVCIAMCPGVEEPQDVRTQFEVKKCGAQEHGLKLCQHTALERLLAEHGVQETRNHGSQVAGLPALAAVTSLHVTGAAARPEASFDGSRRCRRPRGGARW